MQSNRLRMLLTGLCALVVSLFVTSFASAQGVTTAGITGFVTANGQGVPGVTVTVVHVPSGTRSTSVTRSNGAFNVDGLKPGGPYSVTVAATGNYQSQTQGGINLDVGSQARADFQLGSDVVKMEAVGVTASRDTTFDSSSMGTSFSVNSQEISQITSVRQDVQDIMNLDPRAQLAQSANNDEEYTLSVQGQNPRENLFLIDGVSASDNFGLNSNAYAGLRSPLPLPWIESASLKLNEYDLTYSGFVGAVFDATIKTGTNDFHGSFYGIYSGTNFRGPDPGTGVTNKHEANQQHTTGGTLGGPIIKDKLFFFVGYEAFREIGAPPAQEFIVNDPNLSAILAKAASEGDTDQGSFTATNHTWEQNFIGKIDWNISDAHKFEFTFRHTAGSNPLYYNYTSSFETSLSGSWYNSFRTDQSYTAKINSDWSQFLPGLKTEIEATYKRYNGTATLNGTDFPAVTIENVSGTSLNGGSPPYELFLGTSGNYQLNNVYTWEQEEHAYGEYSLGAHTFKFGVSFDRTGLTDTFIPNYLGSYTFSNETDFLNATPTGVTLATAAPGFNLGSAVSHYYLMDIAPLLQDTWQPTSALTVLAGLRMDYPYQPQTPPLAVGLQNALGVNNQGTIDGNYTISPRVGFNYDLPTERKTQVRGGAGLFLGASPAVWLENSYNNAGQLTQYNVSNSSVPISPTYTFTGLNPGQALPPVAASSTAPSYDLASKNIHWPANWKENIAIDHELPIWHMVLTLEADFTQVEKDMMYQEINLKQATSGPAYMPDGAIRYAGNITPSNIGSANFVPGYTTSNFYTSVSSISSSTLETNPGAGPVFLLTNTDKGGGQEYTIELQRKFFDNWSWILAYTHTHATQVYTLGGTTASGSYGSNIYLNPNDNVAYRSAYATPDKVVAALTRRFKFFHGVPNSATTISAQFIAQTGQSYSYAFKGDADGSGEYNDELFYVPTGPNDPKVTWLSQTEETNFFNDLAKNGDLAKYAGQVTPRNAFYSPWQHTVNLHIEQELPIYRPVHLTIFADCFNFANLLSKSWGTVINYGNYGGGAKTLVGTGYNATGNGGAGQYIYTYNAGTITNPTIYSDESRYFIQVGARLEF